MRKRIAYLIGNKLPYFYGKSTLIRSLYSPDKDLNSGEKFLTNYYGFKYEGITSQYQDWGVYFLGGLEKGLVNYIQSEISNFKYFFDIGSNTGTISLPFSSKRDLKIICFEPLEYNFKKLTRNYEINNVLDNHIFHKIALSNKSESNYIYFSDKDNNTGSASLDPKLKSINDYNNKEKVLVEKLDNLYDLKNENIFIKIDVEGLEDKVIEGSSEILKNNNVLMYLETLNNSLLNNLKNNNFKIFYPLFYEKKYIFKNKQLSNNVILKNY